jgi:hypothetical protein
MYFSSPEDGARHSKSWFKVVPGYYLHEKKYEDGDDYWYYADGDGNLYASIIKSIKGKKYAFDNFGRMKKGLQLMDVNSDNTINDIIADDDATYNYETEDEFKKTALKTLDENEDIYGYKFYFFSNDEDHDGSMKTGNQTVTIDGDTFTFKFKKSGTGKGQGENGADWDKHKVYLGGMLFRASSDDKVKILGVTDDKIKEYDTAKFLELAKTFDGYDTYVNNEDKTMPKQGYNHDISVKKGGTLYFWNPKETGRKDFVLVNTSGTMVKSGNKKDGDGYKIITDGNYGLKAILVED